MEVVISRHAHKSIELNDKMVSNALMLKLLVCNEMVNEIKWQSLKNLNNH